MRCEIYRSVSSTGACETRCPPGLFDVILLFAFGFISYVYCVNYAYKMVAQVYSRFFGKKDDLLDSNPRPRDQESDVLTK